MATTQYKFRPNDPASIVLSAVTTGTSAAIPFNDCRFVNWLVEGTGTITAGTVIIESAHDPNYSGTWNQLASVTVTTNAVLGDGKEFPAGGFVRARVSATVTGGTTTVRLNGLLG